MKNINKFEFDFKGSLLFSQAELHKSILEKIPYHRELEIDSLFHSNNTKISSLISSFFGFIDTHLREKGIDFYDLEKEYFKLQKINQKSQFFDK